jgi:tetratricopeptide (TPR) repeat protein
LDELGQMSRVEIASEARRIMGPHASPESLSDAKFNEHIGAAEEHLRAGRYYHAADSFSLAGVYKPDHPAVLAGKSHALFAAGEYVSSALFLSRALAAFPEYVRVDVDLTALLGGQDKIARRLADIEQWYARSGSGQLQFLLSYAYYRTGRLTEAKRAVEVAYQKMPQLPAVQTMKMAIDGAAK